MGPHQQVTDSFLVSSIPMYPLRINVATGFSWEEEVGKPQALTGSHLSHEKKKKLLLSMKYWLFNRDPTYNGFL